jgi:hypothetical protein
MTNPNQPKHNQIFEKLVLVHPDKSPERLVGMIAYAEYERDKVEWIRAKPTFTEVEIDAFLRLYNDRKIQEYRNKAESLLFEYAAFYAEKELKKVLEQEKSKQLIQEIQKVKTGYWNAVGQGILASVIFAVGVGFTSLLISAARPSGGFAKVIEYLTSPDVSSTTDSKVNIPIQKTTPQEK